MTSEVALLIVAFAAGMTAGRVLAHVETSTRAARRNWAREYPDPDAANHVARAAHTLHDGRRR
jgi:hypothetical protein